MSSRAAESAMNLHVCRDEGRANSGEHAPRGKLSWLEGNGPHSAHVRVTPGAARHKGRVSGKDCIEVLGRGGFVQRLDRGNELHCLFPVLGLCANLPRRDLRLTDLAQGIYRTANRGVVCS